MHIPWPTGDHPFLTQLFIARHLLAQAVDHALADLPPPNDCTILLYNETDAGLGDVAFATKLLQLMRTHMPAIDLTLVSTDPVKQRTFGLPDGVTLVEESVFRTDATSAQRRPTLVISAPGIFDHCRHKKQAYERLGIEESVPFQYIAEYGSIAQLKDDTFAPMLSTIEALRDTFMDQVAHEHGLHPDDMGHSAKSGAVVGVFGGDIRPLDHLMRAYTDVHSPLVEWLARPVLGARSCGLAAGELGIHIDDATPLMTPTIEALSTLESPEVHALVLGESSPTAYEQHTSLYVGYAYDGLAIFVDYVSVLEAQSAKDIDVIVPHRGTAATLAQTVFDDDALARLRQRGIGRILIVGNSVEAPNEGPLARAEISLGVGKTVRLLTRYPIPHADFRRLHAAAHPATMVTGDQSFSEAISGGKAVLYLEPVYCKTYHLDAVLDLAGRVAPPAQEILNFGMQYRFDAARYPRIETHLTSRTLYEACRAMNTTIQQHHDCSKPLIEMLTRVLWTLKHPVVADRAHDALTKAWRNAHPERGITIDDADLGALRDAVIDQA